MAGSTIKVTILGDATSAVRALKDTDQEANDFGDRSSGWSGKAALAGAAVAGVGAAFLAAGDAMRAASEDAAQQTVFEAQLRNAGATDEMVNSLNAAIVAGQKLGFTDTDLRDAYSQMYEQTKDVEVSQLNVATAMDVARRANVPLGQATDAISRALNGNKRALIALLPQYGDMIKNTDDVSDVLNNLDEAIGTNAETWAGTSEGQLEVAKIQFSELKESIGAHLLPILAGLTSFLLENLIPGIQKVTHFISENREYFLSAAIGITVALVPALLAWAASALAAAAATIAAAAPVIAITAGLAALALGVVYAYEHFDIFREVVDGFKEAIVGAMEWIRDNWPIVVGILTGGIGLAIAGITTHRDDIVKLFQEVPAKIGSALQGLADILLWPFQVAKVFIGSTKEEIVDIAGDIAEAVKVPINAAIGIINSAIGAVNAIHWPGVSAFGHTIIPGFGGLGLGYVDYLAQGGIVNRPTLAMIGEAGPEAVIPLSRGRNAGAFGTINIVVNAGVGTDGRRVGQQIHQALIEERRRLGPLGLG